MIGALKFLNFFADALVEAAASNDALNKNEPGIKTSCDPDTCSISTTTVACTKGSRASSQISLPGLDWDSQVCNCSMSFFFFTM